MTNVVPFPGGKKTIEDILQEITDNEIVELVVMGYDSERTEFMSSNIRDGAEINWLCDRLKSKLFSSV